MDVLRFQKANCKDCYKCIRRCAVKAIAVRDHHTEVIDEEIGRASCRERV